jgi:hypothetical protein
MLSRVALAWSCLISLAFSATLGAAPRQVTVTFSPLENLEVYDIFELTFHVDRPDAPNPFTDVTLRGTFAKDGTSEKWNIEGFCDSPDGSVFRLRFMPSSPGDYTYTVTYQQGSFQNRTDGGVRVSAGHRRGPLRVDPNYPWHFIWEGTGEHYFFNGTTAYWLPGWRDERIINYSLERLHRLKVNRLRVLLAGSANMFWGERVMTGENFTMYLRPWVAKSPESFENPGIDYTRFNIPYWQKWERMLRFARQRDMLISVVLEISTDNAQPPAASADERRYLRYAVARLGAFSNITYDLGDDLDSFRDEAWAHETGMLIESWDPYKHLATSHPVHPEHQDRASAWFGFTSIQDWSLPQHALMLEQRRIQQKTGRIIPQTNEEYGYEDHYPRWAYPPPQESADALRHRAWEIAMAGAYGTTGESTRQGTNIWPDTGGGWINGRGDDTMVMLKGYEHMVDFFSSFEWWKTEPHDELVNNGAYCLAQPGEVYAVYLPKGGSVAIKLAPGSYEAKWFDPFTGDMAPLPTVEGPEWNSPPAPGWLDWALLLQRRH